MKMTCSWWCCCWRWWCSCGKQSFIIRVGWEVFFNGNPTHRGRHIPDGNGWYGCQLILRFEEEEHISVANYVLANFGLCSKFNVQLFEAKNRVFEFDYQKMNMFEFVRCSKNDVRVRSMFDKMVFDPSLEKGPTTPNQNYW